MRRISGRNPPLDFVRVLILLIIFVKNEKFILTWKKVNAIIYQDNREVYIMEGVKNER